MLVVVGCGNREGAAGTTKVVPLRWEACGDLDCATFEVPLDQFALDVDGPTRIALRAYRQVSKSSNSRHVPLIIHPGGPGADVRAAVVGAREALAPTIEDFDLYALSTRGTIDGTAFDCGESLSDLRVIDVDPDATERFAKGCNDASGALVGKMGTRQSVEDLEDFRRALSFDMIRYLGWSYGATLGATWVMSHPGSLAAMVLDAPSDPRVSRAEEVRLRYVAASSAFKRNPLAGSFLTAGNSREDALARDYLLYEPDTSARGERLVSLRLGETPDGKNDGGIETQIGVHCSDVTRTEARAALDIPEPEPGIGFGAAFDRICLELAESQTPLTRTTTAGSATHPDVMVVSTTGDHVIPSTLSRRLASRQGWQSVVVEADRHLSVGFDAATTKKAMSFLSAGD